MTFSIFWKKINGLSIEPEVDWDDLSGWYGKYNFYGRDYHIFFISKNLSNRYKIKAGRFEECSKEEVYEGGITNSRFKFVRGDNFTPIERFGP